MRLPHHKPAGFTLLEVLIAISIFAVIGLGAYRMLDIIILSQSRVESHLETLRKTERAMQLVSMDFEQLVNRPVRGNYDDKLAAVLSPQQDYLIEFTRQGWRNPLQLPRSQLQRVAYELGSLNSNDDDTGTHLLRHYWNVLDRAQDSEPTTQVLLKNVDDLQIRFLGAEGEWHSQWPALLASGKQTVGLPTAIIFEIHSPALGQIQRLFQLSEIGEWQSAGLQGEVATPDEKNDNGSKNNKKLSPFGDDQFFVDEDSDDGFSSTPPSRNRPEPPQVFDKNFNSDDYDPDDFD